MHSLRHGARQPHLQLRAKPRQGGGLHRVSPRASCGRRRGRARRARRRGRWRGARQRRLVPRERANLVRDTGHHSRPVGVPAVARLPRCVAVRCTAAAGSSSSARRVEPARSTHAVAMHASARTFAPRALPAARSLVEGGVVTPGRVLAAAVWRRGWCSPGVAARARATDSCGRCELSWAGACLASATTSPQPAQRSLCDAVGAAACGVQQLLAGAKVEAIAHVCFLSEEVCRGGRAAASGTSHDAPNDSWY